MSELIEKIKGLDKKLLIGIGIAVAVIIILVIALAVGGNSKPSKGDETQNKTEENSESLLPGVEADTEFETELETEAGTELETEIETEVETEVETEDSTEVAGSENENKNETGSNDGNQGSTTPQPEEEEPLGKGSASQPYLEIPDNNMTVKTEAVPAGKTLYYSVQRVGGLILTIENANAYVITSDGNRYDAQNGKVSLQLENAMASEYVTFQIGNKGGAAASFTLKFTNAYGSRQNPEVIATLGQNKKSLAQGNEVGYYYKYVAEKSGKIRFYLTATADSEMTVTNNRNSATRTFEADGLTDEQGRQYIELEVSKGDNIMIHVTAVPNKRGKYPATDITWEGIYK